MSEDQRGDLAEGRGAAGGWRVAVEDRGRVTENRLAAAAAVRRLVHALVDHEVDEETLARLAVAAEGYAATIEAGPGRIKAESGLSRWEVERADGDALVCFVDCLVSGPANPLSAGGVAHRHGDEAVLQVTLDPGFEGLPGRSHGGIVASLFDEVMGFALYMDGIPAYTAWLRVDYRAAVPVGQPLELRARRQRHEGRKHWIEASLHSPEGPGPTAEALFIAPR